MKYPAPLCEVCWIEKTAVWEPHSMDDSGNIMMRLKDVDVPVKYNTGMVETCERCGKLTVAGIYELMSKEMAVGFESFSDLEQAFRTLSELFKNTKDDKDKND